MSIKIKFQLHHWIYDKKNLDIRSQALVYFDKLFLFVFFYLRLHILLLLEQNERSVKTNENNRQNKIIL
jgi:hypothetical protein